MAKEKRKRATGRRAVGWTALGMGAAIVAERILIGRMRLRPDRFAAAAYGELKADRGYDVMSFDGTPIHVEESGSPRSQSGVIFIHGYCLDRTIWLHQLEAMPPRRRFVFYDARHHGLSGGPPAEALAGSTETLALDLKAVLDASGLKRVVIAGHSMGGMTALEFARTFPEELGERVRGIVLMNTTYTDVFKTVFAAELLGPFDRRGRRAVEYVLRSPRSANLLRLRSDDLSWALVKLIGFGEDSSPSQVEYVRGLLACFPSPGLVEIYRGLRAFDFEQALAKVDVPALVVAGGDDRITTVRASTHMVAEMPQATLEVLEGAGHMAMLEQPEEFNRLLQGFLDKVLVTRKSS